MERGARYAGGQQSLPPGLGPLRRLLLRGDLWPASQQAAPAKGVAAVGRRRRVTIRLPLHVQQLKESGGNPHLLGTAAEHTQ